MDARQHKHVVIAGAGPAGLLAAIKLLCRPESSGVVYSVTIVDVGEDYSQVRDITKKRSWMIGLSAHGLTALKTVPSLYEEYVAKVGMPLEKGELYFGATKLLTVSLDLPDDEKSFVVDRNAIVAALARFINDRFKGSGRLNLCYKHRLLFVDAEKRRVFVRGDASVGGGEKYIGYDVLLGCDGVRSAVRAGILSCHRDFECTLSDSFTTFKGVHINCPPSVSLDTITFLNEVLPNVAAIVLPEMGGKVNIAMSHVNNVRPNPALSSESAEEVAAYLRANFRAFAMDFDDFARQWVAQPWTSTSQVHCNFYHSELLQAMILGDAAHATIPTIGQGMNTALADAVVLDRLLDEHQDDWSKVLPAFSVERVKEGNALSDLSYYETCFSTYQTVGILLYKAARAFGHRCFPSLIPPDPTLLVAMGEKLSVAYDKMTKLGRLPTVRRINDDVKRKYFEEKCGMVTPAPKMSAFTLSVLGLGLAGLAVSAASCVRQTK